MSKEKQAIGELLEEALVLAEEQPYELPKNWIWVKLGYYLNNYDNSRIPISAKKREGIKGDIPYYGASGVIDYVNKWTHEGKYVLIAEDGANLVTRTKPVAFIGEGKIWVNNHAHILNCKSKLSEEYVCYYINSIPLNEYISGTAQPKLNQRNLNNIPLPISPRLEQKRIVEKVERILNKIEEAKRLIEEAKETFELRRAAILDKAFRGDLIEDKESWDELKLGDLISEGPQNGLYKPQTAYGDGSLIVRIDNFYSGYINEWNTLRRLELKENELAMYGLDEGDLLINRVNSIQYLGKSALVRNLKEDCVFESNVMRLKINNELVDNEYLTLYLNSNHGLKELRKNAKHAVNQASINQSDVKNVIVPLPNLVQQELIVKKALELLEKDKMALQLIQQQRKVLEELKQSILSKAFKGELGTYDSNDDSAIELLKSILQEKL